MKLLITGASGLYGSKLAKMALEHGFEVYSSDIQELSVYGKYVKMDVANRAMVKEVFEKVKPDAVIHAATLTDVDKCEQNQSLAWKINVEGTENIVQSVQDVGSYLVYISTDYVFSGKKGNYTETDTPDPINYYGLTKLKAEQVVKDLLPNYFIARPSVIYGATPAAGKINFALWVIEQLRKSEKIRIVTDQWNTPTLNTNLAEMTLEAIERKLTGTFHLCGATRISRYEFAQKIADAFRLSSNYIEPVEASIFTWPAKRPVDSSLSTVKAQCKLKSKPMDIYGAVQQLKKEIADQKA